MTYSASDADHDAKAERRQYPRKNLIDTQLVTVELSPPPVLPKPTPVPLPSVKVREGFQRGILINVSEGGVALQPFQPLARGATSPVRFQLPGITELISATGLVAWVGAAGRAGLKFIDLSAAARAQLRDWMGAAVGRNKLAQDDLFDTAVAAGAEELDLNAAMELIAEHVGRITAASGVAIALRDDQGMVCRVSQGDAPDVGVRLQSDTGLSAFCLRTGEPVHCVDAQQDERVNPEARRSLGFRSVLIVPVYLHGVIAGLLEVLSAEPNAFSPQHITRLQRLSQLLSRAIVDK